MAVKVVARYIRISPRKTRKIVDLIRGIPAVKAEAILDTVNKRPTVSLKRLLKSALDSAKNKEKLEPGDLFISMIKVDKGPMLKRFRAATMGRATMIRHRTSHITMELDIIKKQVKKIVEKETKIKAKPVKAKAEKTKKVVKQKNETN